MMSAINWYAVAVRSFDAAAFLHALLGAVMVCFTKRLPVILIPKQYFVTSVRDDMVYRIRRRRSVLAFTEHA